MNSLHASAGAKNDYRRSQMIGNVAIGVRSSFPEMKTLLKTDRIKNPHLDLLIK